LVLSRLWLARPSKNYGNSDSREEADAVVLVVLNGKEGTGYAVHGDSGLNELLPSILRRVAKMIGTKD